MIPLTHSGFYPTARASVSCTPLTTWVAASKGNWDQVKEDLQDFCINQEFSTYKGPHAGKTLLWFAINDNQDDVVIRLMNSCGLDLLNRNAAPKSGPDMGKSAFWLYCKQVVQHKRNLIPGFLNTLNIDYTLSPAEGEDAGKPVSWILAECYVKQSLSLDGLRGIDLTAVSHEEGSRKKETLYHYLRRNGVPHDTLIAIDLGKILDLLSLQEKKALARTAWEKKLWQHIPLAASLGHLTLTTLDKAKLMQSVMREASYAHQKIILSYLLPQEDFDRRKFFSEYSFNHLELRYGVEFASALTLNSERAALPGGYGSYYDTYFESLKEVFYPIFSNYTQNNPFHKLPITLRAQIIKEFMSVKLEVSDISLMRGLQYASKEEESRNQEKAVDWTAQQTFALWRMEIEGIDKPKKERVDYKDFKRLWQHAAHMAHEENGIVLNTQVRDRIKKAFTGIERPLTRSKLVALIKSCS